MAKSKSGSDPNKNFVTTVATMAAVYGMRKLLAIGWQRATGKTPPDPLDPQVRIVEAFAWAALAGVVAEATKLVAARVTARRLGAGGDSADA